MNSNFNVLRRNELIAPELIKVINVVIWLNNILCVFDMVYYIFPRKIVPIYNMLNW